MEERAKARGVGCSIASIVLCLVATVLLTFRWDIAYAATVYPAWAFSLLGLAIAIAGRPKPFWKVFRWPFVLWLAFTMFFAEEAHSLLRWGSWPSTEWLAERKANRALRIVTLNCAGGSPEAAAEVRRFNPDIVLLQESPGREEVELLAKKLFGPGGGAVAGRDASIIAAGPIDRIELPHATNDFVAGEVTLPSGDRCLVVSLRLTPPVLRFDYLSPECWQAYAADLARRRAELRMIGEFVAQHRRNLPVILGGDFNSGPTPTMASALPNDLRDAFREAGHGWGHSAVNESPLVRIDQLWLSPALRADYCFAQKTENSDHRMVICDAIMNLQNRIP